MHPEEQIKPYERTLNRMHKVKRERWTETLERQICREGIQGRMVLVLAGMNYREHLYRYLMENFERMEIPMAGMMMGEQLKMAVSIDLMPAPRVYNKHHGDAPADAIYICMSRIPTSLWRRECGGRPAETTSAVGTSEVVSRSRGLSNPRPISIGR